MFATVAHDNCDLKTVAILSRVDSSSPIECVNLYKNGERTDPVKPDFEKVAKELNDGFYSFHSRMDFII